MRVISKFRDYYDGLRAIDRDADPLYVRETRSFVWADMPFRHAQEMRARIEPVWSDIAVPPAPPPPVVHGRRAHHSSIERFVVAFCGRAFAGYRIGTAGDVAWDIDTLIARAARANDRALVRQLEQHSRAAPYAQPLDRGSWQRFVAVRREHVGDKPFVAMNAPILVVTDRALIVNPCLADWGFASRVDPYSAWQELSMYLGNNLAQVFARAPRAISDELKAHAHGFDKQSFRNAKNRTTSNRGEW